MCTLIADDYYCIVIIIIVSLGIGMFLGYILHFISYVVFVNHPFVCLGEGVPRQRRHGDNLSNNGDVELFDFEIGSVGDYDYGSDYDYSDDPPSYNHCVGFDHGGDGGGD